MCDERFRTLEVTVFSLLFVAAAAAITANGEEAYVTSINGVDGAAGVELYAGQDILAGYVSVYVDETENLVVQYDLETDWTLDEAHLWIGEDLAEMPQTNKGNPRVGLFPYHHTDPEFDVGLYAFVIPLTELGGVPYVCDMTFFIAAHAALSRENGDGTVQTETGWSDGPRFVDRGSWATYSSIVFACEEDPPPPPPEGCETAYGFGDQTFIDLGMTRSRWGWQITVNAGDDLSTPIYAGAGQNDITKGTHVGDLLYSFDGSELVVTFEMFSGWTMDETHLYAGTVNVHTIAPGKYGNKHDLTDATGDSYRIVISGSTIYIVAHAVVC